MTRCFNSGNDWRAKGSRDLLSHRSAPSVLFFFLLAMAVLCGHHITASASADDLPGEQKSQATSEQVQAVSEIAQSVGNLLRSQVSYFTRYDVGSFSEAGAIDLTRVSSARLPGPILGASALTFSQLQRALDNEKLAVRLEKQGRWREAIKVFEELLAVGEQRDLLRQNEKVLSVYTLEMVGLQFLVGDFPKAAYYAERCARVYDSIFDGRSGFAAACLRILADVRFAQFQIEDGFALLWRAHAIYTRTQSGGEDSAPAVGMLNTIGAYLIRVGRLSEAIRVLELAYNKAGRNSSLSYLLPTIVGNMASAYALLGDYNKAFSLSVEQLVRAEKENDKSELLAVYWRRGFLYRATGDCPAAVDNYKKAIALWDSANDILQLTLAGLHEQLGYGLVCMENYVEAEKVLRVAIEKYKTIARVFGLPFDNEAKALLAYVLLRLEKSADASALALEVLRQVREIVVRLGSALGRAFSPAEAERAQKIDEMHHFLLSVLATAANDSQPPQTEIPAAFHYAIQLGKWSPTAQAFQKALIRSESGALGDLLRRRELLLARLSAIDAQSAISLSQGGSSADVIQHLDAERRDAYSQLSANSSEISRAYPSYFALISINPLEASETQALLARDELLVIFSVGRTESFMEVVGADRIKLIRLDAGRAELDRLVRKVRRGLEATADGPDSAFDTAAASELYRRTLGRAADLTVGVKRIILVPDGPLESLSFAALPMSPSASEQDGSAAPGSWLIDQYAISYLPSVSSLSVARHSKPRSNASESFIGFGAPALAGKVVRPSASTVYVRGEVDARGIRDLAPLPGAEAELRQLSATLKGSSDSVFVGKDATETKVWNLDSSGRLGKARVIGFATHALVAGDFDKSIFTEPGLVMTPPDTPSVIDDGFLRASEAAKLKLDAEWVVLTGCNTAAPDGSPSGRPLSGLARAFLYAGGRALLVSSSTVRDDATRELVTGLFGDWASGSVDKDEALRAAMRRLRSVPQFAQPRFWAPWMLVGNARH